MLQLLLKTVSVKRDFHLFETKLLNFHVKSFTGFYFPVGMADTYQNIVIFKVDQILKTWVGGRGVGGGGRVFLFKESGIHFLMFC